MNWQNQFNLEQLVQLIVVDAALMTGDDFSAGIQAGTLSVNNLFASGIRIINRFITQNNTFIEDQPKIDGLVGVGVLNNIRSQIVENPLQLFQVNP